MDNRNNIWYYGRNGYFDVLQGYAAALTFVICIPKDACLGISIYVMRYHLNREELTLLDV